MPRHRLSCVALLAGLLACDGNINDGRFVQPLTYRVSVGVAGEEGDGPSGARRITNAIPSISISADGRFVAFSSEATSLHPDDPDLPSSPSTDVFVRDTVLKTTELISRESGPAGAPGTGVDDDPDMTPDGRFVAFASASQLDPAADTNLTQDIYVRDRLTHDTILVSRVTGAGGAVGNGLSFNPSISDDGRYVAFISRATNLDPAKVDTILDIFVRDLATDTTTLISRATGIAGVKSNGDDSEPGISGDGSLIVWTSLASNLHPADFDPPQSPWPDIYVRDWMAAAPTTDLVSRRSGPGGVKLAMSGRPAISADGRYVAFTTETQLIGLGDTNNDWDIYLRDLQGTNETTIVSLHSSGAQALTPPGGPGTRLCDFASISADGRYIVFSSFSATLVDDDDNGEADVFMHDRITAETIRLSVRSFGGQGSAVFPPESSVDIPLNGNSAVTGDGRFVAFGSILPDIVENDNNLTWDVFVRGPLR